MKPYVSHRVSLKVVGSFRGAARLPHVTHLARLVGQVGKVLKMQGPPHRRQCLTGSLSRQTRAILYNRVHRREILLIGCPPFPHRLEQIVQHKDKLLFDLHIPNLPFFILLLQTLQLSVDPD